MKTAENLDWRVNKIVTSEPCIKLWSRNLEYYTSRITWSHSLIIS